MTGQRRTEPPRWISGDDLAAALPMAEAIVALESAILAGDLPHSSDRVWHETADGQLYLMPASGAHGAGVKANTVRPANAELGVPVIQGVYLYFDAASATPRAMLGAAELTRLRTPAVSGLATKYLARADAHRLLIFGTGMQARAHVDAMRAVRPIDQITIVGHGAKAAALADELVAEGLNATAGSAADIKGADIICTCTTATTPLFAGADTPPGVHINAIGAYQADTREVDSLTVQRAKVVIEDLDSSLGDAGDLLIPLSEGVISRDHLVRDLRGLVLGAPVRTQQQDITLFKSVGAAFEDLIVVAAAIQRLEQSS